jgi:hypothetical protein
LYYLLFYSYALANFNLKILYFKEAIENLDEKLMLTQMAIINCLERGGSALSLEAHFIDELPEIFGLLYPTLVYINLSYNDFAVRESD